MDKSLLGEFRLDWLLAGKAEQTAESFAEDDRIVTCYVFLADETKFAKSVQG